MRYSITKSDFDRVTKFAEASYKDHYAHGRSNQEIFQHIVRGKLGEVAYKAMVGDLVNEVNLTPSPNPDEGWDFVRNDGQRIQVKTILPWSSWVSFSNYYWDRLVVIQMNGNICTLASDMHITDVRAIAKKSKYSGYYINTKDI